MKVFIALAVACLFANALALKDNLRMAASTFNFMAHFQECIEQEGVSADEATKLMSKDFSAVTDTFKCFITCISEKIETLKDNILQESVILEKFGSIIGEDNIRIIVDKCGSLGGNERCEIGYNIFECFEGLKKELNINF